MGTYLATGIVQNLRIRKKEINTKLPIEAIKTSLQKEVHLDHYIYGENDSDIYWTLKLGMLEGNFLEFLESQFQLYDEQKKRWQEDFQKIKQVQTGEGRLKLAENGLPHFQIMTPIYNHIKIKKENGFETDIPLIYTVLAFFIEGKIVMECYGEILDYFTKNIRLQNQNYPISNCLKIMITS